MLSAAVSRDLKRFLGDGAVSDAIEERACYSYDAAAHGPWPDVVVFPTNPAHVAKLMRYAHRRGIPLVPRGAGSGCCGGGVAVRGGILVSFERMDHILSLDRELMVGQAEPGVITARFQREVERLGLFYPPDPSSAEVCTLGGNLAHGAGGLRGRKYGTTRDYVLGLEAVMADGQMLGTGFYCPGQPEDLTGLLVGSEGTLAMVTKMALRLIPRPESFCALLFVLPYAQGAVQLAHAILRAGVVPAAMEFMDRWAVDCLRAHSKAALPPEDGHVLLVELAGRRREVLHEANQVECLGRAANVRATRRAVTFQDRQKIWSVRRALSPSMARAATKKISHDVCVPPKALSPLLSDIEAIGRKRSLVVVTFGHLGDGNLHVNIMTDGGREQLGRAQLATEDLFRVVLASDGTISGEHGIGLTKARYLSWELSAETLAAHRKVKEAFDPTGIVNPGKILYASDLSDSEGEADSENIKE